MNHASQLKKLYKELSFEEFMEMREIYPLINAYSDLLDEGKEKEANDLLGQLAEFLNDKPSLKKLADYLIEFCQSHSLKLTFIPPEQIRIEQFKKALFPLVKFPKQYEDSKYRGVKKDDLALPVNYTADEIFKPYGIKKEDVEVAIQGGLAGIEWTFDENRVVHAIFSLFDQAGWPEKIHVTRSALYEAMGVKSYVGKDGKKRYYEGPGYLFRKRLHKILFNISNKNVCFVYSAITGKDKKGDPLRMLVLDYSPIIKVRPCYVNVEKKEFQPFLTGNESKKMIQKRLSHYEILINKNIKGDDVGRYFRLLPSALGKEISDYRTARGQRPSGNELDFIEFLYTIGETPVEINYKKLAQKLKIKTRWRYRQIISKCYETALALKFALRIEQDQPGISDKKDVIHLNPERFYKLRVKNKQSGQNTENNNRPQEKNNGQN